MDSIHDFDDYEHDITGGMFKRLVGAKSTPNKESDKTIKAPDSAKKSSFFSLITQDKTLSEKAQEFMTQFKTYASFDVGFPHNEKVLDLSKQTAVKSKQPKNIDYYNTQYKVKKITEKKNDLIIKLNKAVKNNSTDEKDIADTIDIATKLFKKYGQEKAAIDLAKIKYYYDKDSSPENKTLLDGAIQKALDTLLFEEIIYMNNKNNFGRKTSLEKAKESLEQAKKNYKTILEIQKVGKTEKSIIDEVQHAKELVTHKTNYVNTLTILFKKATNVETSLTTMKNNDASLIKKSMFSTTPMGKKESALKEEKEAKADVDELIEANEKVLEAEKEEPVRLDAKAFNRPLTTDELKGLKNAKSARATLDALITSIQKKNPSLVFTPDSATSASNALKLIPTTTPKIVINDSIQDMAKRCQSLMSQISDNNIEEDNRILLRQLAKHLIILVTLINQK